MQSYKTSNINIQLQKKTTKSECDLYILMDRKQTVVANSLIETRASSLRQECSMALPMHHDHTFPHCESSTRMDIIDSAEQSPEYTYHKNKFESQPASTCASSATPTSTTALIGPSFATTTMAPPISSKEAPLPKKTGISKPKEMSCFVRWCCSLRTFLLGLLV